MKILIVSDTHRKNDNYFDVLKLENPNLVIHCGDAEGSEYALTQGAKCPVKIVLGNNDFFSDLPKELEFEVGKYKVWVTHGHHYYVSVGPQDLLEEAKANGCNIVMYGHTHRPLMDGSDGEVLVLNPGSISFPRQEGKQPSYMIMETDGEGEAHFRLYYL